MAEEILSSEPVGERLLPRPEEPRRPAPPSPMILGLSRSSSVSVGVGEPGVMSFSGEETLKEGRRIGRSSYSAGVRISGERDRSDSMVVEVWMASAAGGVDLVSIG